MTCSLELHWLRIHLWGWWRGDSLSADTVCPPALTHWTRGARERSVWPLSGCLSFSTSNLKWSPPMVSPVAPQGWWPSGSVGFPWLLVAASGSPGSAIWSYRSRMLSICCRGPPTLTAAAAESRSTLAGYWPASCSLQSVFAASPAAPPATADAVWPSSGSPVRWRDTRGPQRPRAWRESGCLAGRDWSTTSRSC